MHYAIKMVSVGVRNVRPTAQSVSERMVINVCLQSLNSSAKKRPQANQDSDDVMHARILLSFRPPGRAVTKSLPTPFCPKMSGLPAHQVSADCREVGAYECGEVFSSCQNAQLMRYSVVYRKLGVSVRRVFHLKDSR
jgi:hypothetical protein